jgi:preprotein translocase subunit YajC
MLSTLTVFAQDTPKPQGDFQLLLLLAPVLFLLFWLLVARPEKRRQQQERDSLLKNMKKNDKVVTTAGIYGTVISVSETEDEVVVKVDDSTRLRMLKSSILRNLTNEETAKAEKDAKKNPKKEGAA